MKISEAQELVVEYATLGKRNSLEYKGRLKEAIRTLEKSKDFKSSYNTLYHIAVDKLHSFGL